MAWRQDNNGPHDPNEASQAQNNPGGPCWEALQQRSPGDLVQIWSTRKECHDGFPLPNITCAATPRPYSTACKQVSQEVPHVCRTHTRAGCESRLLIWSCLQVMNIFNITQRNFPGAALQTSTLDAFFAKLLEAAPHANLPVVTGEIGDSWVYGGMLPFIKRGYTTFLIQIMYDCTCICASSSDPSQSAGHVHGGDPQLCMLS